MTAALRPSSAGPVLTTALGLIVLVALWEIAARTYLADLRIVPAPSQVVFSLFANFPAYSPHLLATGHAALLGFLWGNGIAIVLALIVVLLPVIEPAIARLALAINCLPMLVISPIMQIFFTGITPVVILSAMFVLFTTFVAVLLGLQQVDRAILEVVHVAGGNRFAQLRRVRLMACLPSLAGGLAIAAPAAVAGAMVGEYMGSTRGLGIAMVHAQASFQVDRTWALALIAATMALGTFVLVQGLAWIATPWARDRAAQIPSMMDVRQTVSGLQASLTRVALGLVSLAVVLGAWLALVTLLGLDPYFAKTPVDVWNFVVSGPQAAEHRAALASPLAVTIGHALIGLAAGFAAGVVFACAAKMWPRMDRAFAPYRVMISAVPMAAMIPLISIAFGRGIGAVTMVVALLTFFPTLINVMTGLSAAPQQASDVVRVAGGTQRQILFKVLLPYSVPWLFASLRIAAPNAIGAALVAEWLITGDGMAKYMLTVRGAGNFTATWTSGVLLMAVSFLAYILVSLIEERVMRRRNGTAGRPADA